MGHSNAIYGNITAHQAICAFARDRLLAAKEVAEARGFRMLHAIVDAIYVHIQAAFELGLPLQALWDEVQRSNMAKAVLQPDGSFKVVRRADGKILKPEGWTPPDIEDMVDKICGIVKKAEK